MLYRINKIIAVGIGLLILALTANNAFGQYCIGDTAYVVRDEKGKRLSDAEMEKVVIKTINGEKAVLKKDESGAFFTKWKNGYPNFIGIRLSQTIP